MPLQSTEESLAKKNFFKRTPGEHLTFGALRAPQVAWGAVSDASGWSFITGSFWSARYAHSKGASASRISYLKARKGGASYRQAMASINGTYGGKTLVRGGRFLGALGLYSTLSMGMESNWGPGYGVATELLNTGASAFTGRLGISAGAAVGGWMGGMAGAGIGAVVGGLTGLIVPMVGMHYAFEEGPKLGYRLARRGFGNLYGPYRDTQQVATMRQASLQAISQSHMNARSALGGEAALLHFT